MNQTTIRKITGWAIAMWFLASAFYFYEFLLQVAPAVMLPELKNAFSANATAIGVMGGFYFLAYAGMQIPVGLMIDNLGPRRLLSGAALVCSIGSVLFALSSTIYLAAMSRFFIGLGSAFAVVGAMSVVSRWFPPHRFALFTGLVVTIGMLGATAGGAPIALLLKIISWREVSMLFAAVGLILAIGLYAVVRDKPAPTNESAVDKLPLKQSLKAVLGQKQVWLIAIYGGLMFAPTSGFAALWGVRSIVSLHAITRAHAALVVSLIFIGWAVGGPLFGWYSNFRGNRKEPMYIASIMAFILFSAAIYLPQDAVSLAIIFFAFGFFSSGFVLAFTVIKEVTPPASSATALGFMNMLNMIGATIAQPLIGWLLDHFWAGHHAADGSRVYLAFNYEQALALLPLCLLVALFLIPFIQETYCREQYNQY